MKKIIGILFSVWCVTAGAQTSIDVIRASNFYAEATRYYNSSSYDSTLEKLIESETNLKGKTNRDLEYLKIMTYYKLKDYSTSYKLMTSYFESPPWKDNAQSYRNVELLSEELDYEEVLTEIFVELEDWNNIQNNIDPKSVAEEIAEQLYSDLNEKLSSVKNLQQDDLRNDGYVGSTDRSQNGYGSRSEYKVYSNNITRQPYITDLVINNEDPTRISISGTNNFNGKKEYKTVIKKTSRFAGTASSSEVTKCDPYRVSYPFRFYVELEISEYDVSFEVVGQKSVSASSLSGDSMGGSRCVNLDLDDMLDDFVSNNSDLPDHFDGLSIRLTETQKLALKKDPLVFKSTITNYLEEDN